MEFRKVNTYKEFVSLKEEWNALLDRIEDPQIFYKWEWTDCYLQYYDSSLQECLNIIIGYEKGKTIAIFPFVLKDTSLGFITEKTTDYNMIYIDRNYNKYNLISKALEYLLQDGIVKKAVLLNVPSATELFIMLDVLRNLHWNAYLEENVALPRLLRRENKKTNYQHKQVGDIERKKRRLAEGHKVEVLFSQKVENKVWEFIKQHHQKKYSTSVFARGNVVEFYEHLVQALENNVEISELIVDDQIAAVHFGFKDERKIYYYIPVYDASYAQNGVGMILLNEMINNYAGLEFDFLKGNESYKYYWSNNVRMSFHLQGFKEGKEDLVAKLILKLKNLKFMRKALGR